MQKRLWPIFTHALVYYYAYISAITRCSAMFSTAEAQHENVNEFVILDYFCSRKAVKPLDAEARKSIL